MPEWNMPHELSEQETQKLEARVVAQKEKNHRIRTVVERVIGEWPSDKRDSYAMMVKEYLRSVGFNTDNIADRQAEVDYLRDHPDELNALYAEYAESK